MRSFSRSMLLLICLIGWLSGTGLGHSDDAATSATRLFLGDRDCGDNLRDCLFAGVFTPARYLHVVLHDLPNNDDWQIQLARTCAANMPVVADGRPVGLSGYLEVVIDVQALVGSRACYLFRGRHHYLLTYYAAYFDSNSSPDAQMVFPGYEQSGGLPDLPDLDVAYLHRTPALPYEAHPNQPSEGQQVTWIATVRNSGELPAQPFSFRWRLDGHVLQSEATSESLAAGRETTFAIVLPWRAAPHRLTFEILVSQEEIGYSNNRLTVRTDALTLGFWVEQSAFTYFEQHQWHYCRELACAGSTSLADWLQRQVAAWNALFARSTDPRFAPTGIADRVRLDELIVVPDGSLPLHGGIATNTPDLRDHSVDLEWGLPAAGVDHAYRRVSDGPFDIDWGLLHELSHARSLTDIYRFDIAASDSNSIAVRNAADQPIYDPAHPLDTGNTLRAFYSQQGSLVLFQNAERDLMSCTCTPNYSTYSTLIFNRIRSQRARCGNVNAPCTLGDWFLDLPPRNVIQVVNAHGRPVPDGTLVRSFADTDTSYTGHHFDQGHVTTLVSHHGLVALGPDPFRSHGEVSLAAHNLILLEIQTGRQDVYCFTEPTTFNLAFWSGYRDVTHPAVYRLRMGRQDENDCRLTPPRPLVNEPFGVSPYTSATTVIGTPRQRTLRVTLRDDASPPHAMHARRLELRATDEHIVATGSTDAAGMAFLRLPATNRPWQLVDVTDNGLIIPLGSGVRSLPAVRRR